MQSLVQEKDEWEGLKRICPSDEEDIEEYNKNLAIAAEIPDKIQKTPLIGIKERSLEQNQSVSEEPSTEHPSSSTNICQKSSSVIKEDNYSAPTSQLIDQNPEPPSKDLCAQEKDPLMLTSGMGSLHDLLKSDSNNLAPRSMDAKSNPTSSGKGNDLVRSLIRHFIETSNAHQLKSNETTIREKPKANLVNKKSATVSKRRSNGMLDLIRLC